MSERLSWVFELFDRVSSPAKDMDKALGGVEEKLHAAEVALARSKLDKLKDPLEKNAAALRIQRMELAHVAAAHREAGESAGGFMHKLQELFFLKEAAHFVGELAHKVREFGSEIVDAVGSKQRNMLGLEAMLGSRDKAVAAFEDVERAAARSGTAVETVMARTKNLLSAGFDLGEVKTIRKGVADLAAIDPAKAEALSEAIADIGRNGMLTGRQLMALKHILPLEDLRKQLGITADGMNKLLDGTKAVEAGKAVSAILKTIRDRYSDGVLGSLGEKNAKTIDKLIDRVKMIPELFVSAVAGFDDRIGGGSISRALENIAAAFEPGSPSADRMVERARELVDRLGRAFGVGGREGLFAELAGPDGAQKVVDVFEKIASGVERAIPVLAKAGKLAWGTVEAMATLFDYTVGGKLGDKLYAGFHPTEQHFDEQGTARAVLADPNASYVARQHAMQVIQAAPGVPPLLARPAAATQAQAAVQAPDVTNHITFAPTLTFVGVKDAEHAKHETINVMTGFFEQLGMQAGG